MTSVKKVIFICTLAMIASVAIAERPDIQGTVVDEQGNAISDAVVAVYTARLRIGTSPYCPSCYADCRKQTKSDDEGHFLIPALDPKLLFRLLFVAEGHSPQFVDNVDAAKGPIVVSLLRIAPERSTPGHVMKGLITEPDGNPVAGATITPFGIEMKQDRKTTDSDDIPFDIEIDEQGNWEVKTRHSIRSFVIPTPRPVRPDEVDPLAVTNEEGEFCLTSVSSDLTVLVTVRAHGLAAVPSYKLHTGSQRHHIKLGRGVSVKGR